jgi:uncharacterized protein (TIGR02145 family)
VIAGIVGVVTFYLVNRGDGPAPKIENSESELKIGGQVWSLKNLDVAYFRNGDPIPEAKTEGEWKAYVLAGEPAWCSCAIDSSGDSPFGQGKLYNFFAVSDRRKLAPEGWKIPSKDDWKQLYDQLGSESRAGSKLKSKEGWSGDAIGTNSSGFSAKPFCKRASSGVYDNSPNSVYYWTSTSDANETAWYSALTSGGAVSKGFSHNGCGYAVRCIRE